MEDSSSSSQSSSQSRTFTSMLTEKNIDSCSLFVRVLLVIMVAVQFTGLVSRTSALTFAMIGWFFFVFYDLYFALYRNRQDRFLTAGLDLIYGCLVAFNLSIINMM